MRRDIQAVQTRTHLDPAQPPARPPLAVEMDRRDRHFDMLSAILDGSSIFRDRDGFQSLLG